MNISSITKKTPIIRKVEKVNKTPETKNHLYRDTLAISTESRNKSLSNRKKSTSIEE